MDKLLNHGIALQDAIRIIQDELIASQKEREKKNIPPLFKVDSLTIEANCIFTEKESGDAGFNLKLLSLFSSNAGVTLSEENSYIHKIKLEFKAIEPSNDENNGILAYLNNDEV